jgi:RsiW-degrading membrane proteinase PrsW (M82 family)
MDVVNTLLGVVLSILAAVVPTAIYALLIWWGDRYEKEPLGLLAVAFVWGAVPAIVISLLAEAIFGLPLAGLQAERLANVLEASALAPLVEEVAKALALVGLFLIFRWEFDDPLDGMVYGALVGIGFGMTENLLYFLSTFFEDGWSGWSMVVILRAVVFGLNHAFFTAFSGVGLGVARLVRRGWQRWLAPLLALGVAMLFHSLHNLGVALADVSLLGLLLSWLIDVGGILVLLVIMLLAWRQERSWIEVELKDEVDGLLTGPQYEGASTYGRRLQLWWDAWKQGGWRAAQRQGRVHRQLTELAFRKHQLRALDGDDDVALLAEIQRLRQEIAADQVEADAMSTPA